MIGLRGAGVLGASVALAGGVAYLIWTHVSSAREEKPKTRPGRDGRRGEEVEEEEEKEKLQVVREQEVKVVQEEEVVQVEVQEVQAVQEEVKEVQEEEEEEEADEPVAAEAAAQKTSESRPRESAATQVLVLGLDGAGKSSILHCLATGFLEQDVQPTQGFNAVSININNMHIEFLEIGGKEELRPYWQRYMSKALMLVFVVDSSNPQHFPVAKRHLHELLASDPRLPLMVLANKQDLPGACSITELHDALSLSEAGDRRLFLINTYVKRGEAELSSGIQDARDLIIQMVCDGR